MCRSNRQRRLLQQDLFDPNFILGVQRRGCCGARKQRNLLREVESGHNFPEITQTQPNGGCLSTANSHQGPMAGIIAISIGLGAEKLGRKISDKRLERKEKKAAEKRDSIYGHAESSFTGAAQYGTVFQTPREERKSQEARREQAQGERRRSVSSERTLLPDHPPPRYEEVVRNDQRGAHPQA